MKELRESPIAIAGREQAPERFEYWVEILSEGQGRRALTLREVGPPGPVGQAALAALVEAGEAAAFGPPATLSRVADGQRILPLDPPLSVPTYVSWNAGHSDLVDAFVELYCSLHADPAGDG